MLPFLRGFKWFRRYYATCRPTKDQCTAGLQGIITRANNALSSSSAMRCCSLRQYFELNKCKSWPKLLLHCEEFRTKYSARCRPIILSKRFSFLLDGTIGYTFKGLFATFDPHIAYMYVICL